MSTNDHTVPQSYLRRFAEKRGKGRVLVARRADEAGRAFEASIRNVAAVKGFYWTAGPNGEPYHGMERLLGRIETRSTRAFNAVLDHPQYALPPRWPLPEETRQRLSWWMAAQMLRTTRQRSRLGHLLSTAEPLEVPPVLVAATADEAHLLFIVGNLSRLAAVLHQRPWGLGFSDACLATSDVPMVILNEHDADDQVLAAAVETVLLALDPHRFLVLPNLAMQEDDRWKRRDHRLKLDGGLGLALSQMIRDAANRHIFYHPQHAPLWVDRNDSLRGRVPRVWEGDDLALAPEYYLSYGVLPPDMTVERRWLTEHPPPRTPAG